MEVLELSAHCSLLRLKGVTLLLDCGLEYDADPSGMFSTPPFEAIDLAAIDVVLLSNHNAMTALPLLLAHTAFSGQVYATEPSLHYGRIVMEEMAFYLGPDAALHNDDERRRRPMAPYCIQDVTSSLARVQTLSYLESVPIATNLTLKALSSSFSIGAANWILESHHDKIGIVTSSSAASRRHPAPLDWTALRNCHVMVMRNFRPSTFGGPDVMLLEMCSRIEGALKGSGNVLLPVSPCGVVYDIIEFLNSFLATKGLTHVPMYFVSPVSDASLAYSGIVSEWLCPSKQAMPFDNKHPFVHDELVKNNRLRYYTSFDGAFQQEYREPCIAIAGHASLEFGDGKFFLERWCTDRKNALVITEPEFSDNSFVARWKSRTDNFQMQVVETVIDARLSLEEASKLVRQVAPKHVVLPSQAEASEFFTSEMPPLSFTSPFEAVKAPFDVEFERAFVSAKLARELIGTPVRKVEGGVSTTSVRATIRCDRNAYTIDAIDAANEASRLDTAPILVGDPTTSQLLEALERRGISDVTLTRLAPDDFSVEEAIDAEFSIPSLQATFRLRPGRTDIETDSDHSRELLLSALMDCVHKI